MLAGVTPLAHRLTEPAWERPGARPEVTVDPSPSVAALYAGDAGRSPEGAAMLAGVTPLAHRQGGPALGPRVGWCHPGD